MMNFDDVRSWATFISTIVGLVIIFVQNVRYQHNAGEARGKFETEVLWFRQQMLDSTAKTDDSLQKLESTFLKKMEELNKLVVEHDQTKRNVRQIAEKIEKLEANYQKVLPMHASLKADFDNLKQIVKELQDKI